MNMFATEIDGQWYNVFYHPHINKFMIIKTEKSEQYLMKEFNGKWRCLNPVSGSPLLPVEQLYAYSREALELNYDTGSQV